MPDIPSQKSVIAGLIKSARGHVTGEGIRLDASELELVLAKAYNAGEDSMRQYQILTPQDVRTKEEVVQSIISNLYSRLKGNEPSANKLRAALQQAYDEGKRTLASDPRVAEHTLTLNVTRDERMEGSCQKLNCKWRHDFDSGADLDDILNFFEEHLAQVIDPLANLPEGRYFDGTYEWDFDGGEWFPLQAPQGMPTKPNREGLRKVVTSYIPI